ncbi:hypothetical protein H8356DRAFT_1320493 [Neocallimastix lanati (nom. inval.)]|nr:hypothetical protein H8356DRAFT_1320493 [Neocallimastix sp. JGI-2020a]
MNNSGKWLHQRTNGRKLIYYNNNYKLKKNIEQVTRIIHTIETQPTYVHICISTKLLTSIPIPVVTSCFMYSTKKIQSVEDKDDCVSSVKKIRENLIIVVIDRTLYKLNDLVRYYVHKILTFTEYYIDEDSTKNLSLIKENENKY